MSLTTSWVLLLGLLSSFWCWLVTVVSYSFGYCLGALFVTIQKIQLILECCFFYSSNWKRSIIGSSFFVNDYLSVYKHNDIFILFFLRSVVTVMLSCSRTKFEAIIVNVFAIFMQIVLYYLMFLRDLNFFYSEFTSVADFTKSNWKGRKGKNLIAECLMLPSVTPRGRGLEETPRSESFFAPIKNYLS